MLEAAVVLEAWAGVPGAARARHGARADAGARPREPRAERAKRRPARPRSGVVAEGAAFVVDRARDRAVGGAAGGASSAADVVERALKVALPLTLALQWGLRSRYLGRPKGLLELARHPRALALGACALVARADRRARRERRGRRRC